MKVKDAINDLNIGNIHPVYFLKGNDQFLQTFFIQKIIQNDKVSKISVVGAGMITQPGVAQKFFNALAKKKINIMVISTSEIKISVLIDQKHTNTAVKVLHKEFDLE